jgi:hypothetical protein
MVQEIGESREAWGLDVWNKASDIANNVKASDRPFYIVYACKEDKAQSEHVGKAVFKQAFKMYKEKPPAILGILVWYVDEAGDLLFQPDLSAPFDVPLDERLLSDKSEDTSERLSAQGEKLKVLVS